MEQWMAVVRSRGALYPVNVSDRKLDVTDDARLNTRVLVMRATEQEMKLFFSEGWQRNLARIRAEFGLPGVTPQELEAEWEREMRWCMEDGGPCPRCGGLSCDGTCDG